MPLQETVQEPEPTAALGNETAAPAATQGYEYIRQDGTVEYAANRDEAIKLCPVLGNLAMEDPNAADLLLDLASIGQAKMAEKIERPKPEIPKQELDTQSEKPAKSTEPNKVRQVETETAADVVRLHQQFQEAVSTGIVQEQKHVEVAAFSNAATVLEKVAARGKPERHSHQERPSPLRRTMAEVRMLHERQIQDTAQAAPPDDKKVQLLPTRVDERVELARKTRVHEVLEVEQTSTIMEQPPAKGQEQVEYPVLAAISTYLPDELAVANVEQLVIEPETADWANEQVEFVPPVIDTLVGDELNESIDGINELTGDVSAVAETVIEAEQIEPISLADELDKEPLELHEDFIEPLQALVAISAEQVSVNVQLTTGAAELFIDDKPENQPMPAIAVIVAERLGELEADEKEAVAPVLTDIVETMQLIDVLEAEGAAPEAAETMQAELEELVIILFEHLGIEYDPEDIEHFSAVLLRSDFQPPQPEVTEPVSLELEHDGTHEAKIHFGSTTAGFMADMEQGLKRLLGMFVLFSAMTHRPVEPAIATV